MFQCAACNGEKIVEVTHELDGTLAVVPTFDTCPTCDGTGTTADDLSEEAWTFCDKCKTHIDPGADNGVHECNPNLL